MKKKWFWLALTAAAGYWLLRREGLRGGASDEEVRSALPGDELIPDAMVATTHAVTIAAPPRIVWKWLVQAGYRGAGRAGWYSESAIGNFLERLFLGLTVPPDQLGEPSGGSAEEILPEFQQTAVGDIVPDGPPGSAYFTVKAFAPERAWVLYSDSHIQYMSPTFLRGTPLQLTGAFTWVFVLEPTGGGQTRLILRTLGTARPVWMAALMAPAFYAGEAVYPRLILNGVKRRAEQMYRAES